MKIGNKKKQKKISNHGLGVRIVAKKNNNQRKKNNPFKSVFV